MFDALNHCATATSVNIMASKEEVVYDLLGIVVSKYAEINVYFDDEIIHLEKSGNCLCGHCTGLH